MKRSEHAALASSTSLAGLPPDVLLTICGHLSARDLAAVAMQSAYLRHLASDSLLWHPLALARWPGADASRHHGGDWHSLYVSRAPMPHAFPLACDRIATVTAAQQHRHAEREAGLAAPPRAELAAVGGCGAVALPQLVFEEVMHQTFAVGLACSRDRSVRRSAEWQQLKRDLTWWAAIQPQLVVGFIRGAHEALAAGGAGGWGGAAPRGWADTPWRRSAVAFMQDLGLLTGAHASVLNRVEAEAQALDQAIRGVQREAPAAMAPSGIPSGHWWFS